MLSAVSKINQINQIFFQLETSPVDLSKLRDVVKNDVKNAEYNKFIIKVNITDYSHVIKKKDEVTQY